MSTENQDNNQQQQDAGKDEKKFQDAMKKVIALLGSEQALQPLRKIGGDTIAEIVAELTKEDRERIAKEVKEDLKKLIETNVEFKKQVNQKRQELEKLEKDKKKEFVEAANKLFNKIDNIGQIQKDFESSLRDAGPDSGSTVLNTSEALKEEAKNSDTNQS